MLGKCKGKKETDGEKGMPCITLIGMPGSGKSTIGSLLAQKMNWAFMDTDYLLEALYACKLQELVDSLGKEKFLDTEEQMILALKCQRCVIATGGSVVYKPEAMRLLASLGPLIYIESDLNCLLERIALKPQRGIAMAPGQSLDELYAERCGLYEKYADLTCNSAKLRPDECVDYIYIRLKKLLEKCGAAGRRAYYHD